MTEFTINFIFESAEQKAAVVVSYTGDAIEYDIRPEDPSLVQQFGKQVVIFKRNGVFRSNNRLDENHPEFYRTLVNKLQEKDIAELEF